MKKTIIVIFGIIGVLLLCLIVWAFVFGNGFESIWNAVATPINTAWAALTGNDTLIPAWGENDNMGNISDATTAAGAL